MGYYDFGFGGLFMWLFWGLIIWAFVVMARGGSCFGGHCSARHEHLNEDRSLAILKERYAKGEISKKEFEEMKNDLQEKK